MNYNNTSPLGDGGCLWLVTGSQHLYGDETLKKVAEHSQQIAMSLDKSKQISASVIFKPTVKSPEEIYAICQEANTDKNCIGIVAWMHTFSPAKMWIGGLKILQKPLLHLHTQFNRDIPGRDSGIYEPESIGDRNFGFI
jgi:L-arabinose isomerase